MFAQRLIAVIGGTGAQGIPIVRDLVKSGQYTVRLLTRNVSHPRVHELQSYGPVEPLTGSFASASSLRALFHGAWGAFVNIDGFNAGEKTEMFWAIRAYELAIEEGVQMFVYGNLDFVYKKSGYDPKFRIGHYDGKGRIGEWILQQNKDNRERMKAGLFTTGPYIEMTITKGSAMTPTIEDGVLTWRLPLGEGTVPHVTLEDCGHYVKWMFDHPERADGMDLEVAIDHIKYDEMAKAFTKVTGKPARYIDVPIEEWLGPKIPDRPAGYNAVKDDPATMTFRDNFTGFWWMWKHSGKNEGVIKRDYKLLDEIHPQRIRTAEEWFRREEESGREKGLGSLWERVQAGSIKEVLKNSEKGRVSTI